MALFWHNHFATAYSKIAGVVRRRAGDQDDGAQGGRAARAAGTDRAVPPVRARQLPGPADRSRDGSGDARLARWPARTPASGRRRTSAARSWSCSRSASATTPSRTCTPRRACSPAGTCGSRDRRSRNDPNTYYEFVYNANQHDTAAKTFTFAIYGDGGQARFRRAPAADGMQDGIDFITALARHPGNGAAARAQAVEFLRQRARAAGPGVRRERLPPSTCSNDTEMKPVVTAHPPIRLVPRRPDRWYTRYSWPVEFVVRAIREIGWEGFSVDTARTPLTNMGQTLFEPPDVAGWELGPGWFSTGAMLARMNFAATLAANQQFNLARAAAPYRSDAGDAARLLPRPAVAVAVRARAVQRAAGLLESRAARGPDPTRSSTRRPPGSPS